MTMFSLYELMDEKKDYQKACMEIVNRRVGDDRKPWAAAHTESKLRRLLRPDRFRVLGLNIGDEAVEYLKKIHPLDLAFRGARITASCC